MIDKLIKIYTSAQVQRYLYHVREGRNIFRDKDKNKIGGKKKNP